MSGCATPRVFPAPARQSGWLGTGAVAGPWRRWEDVDGTRHLRVGHMAVEGGGPIGCGGAVTSRDHSPPRVPRRATGMQSPSRAWIGRR